MKLPDNTPNVPFFTFEKSVHGRVSVVPDLHSIMSFVIFCSQPDLIEKEETQTLHVEQVLFFRETYSLTNRTFLYDSCLT